MCGQINLQQLMVRKLHTATLQKSFNLQNRTFYYYDFGKATKTPTFCEYIRKPWTPDFCRSSMKKYFFLAVLTICDYCDIVINKFLVTFVGW